MSSADRPQFGATRRMDRRVFMRNVVAPTAVTIAGATILESCGTPPVKTSRNGKIDNERGIGLETRTVADALKDTKDILQNNLSAGILKPFDDFFALGPADQQTHFDLIHTGESFHDVEIGKITWPQKTNPDLKPTITVENRRGTNSDGSFRKQEGALILGQIGRNYMFETTSESNPETGFKANTGFQNPKLSPDEARMAVELALSDTLPKAEILGALKTSESDKNDGPLTARVISGIGGIYTNPADNTVYTVQMSLETGQFSLEIKPS